MFDKFFKREVEYFWEYEYPFGEVFLKGIFQDKYRRKYSLSGNGIYNLIDGSDGKIYELKLTQAKSNITADTQLSRNVYQNEMVELIKNNLPACSISKNKFITFPLGKYIAKIEITRKMSEPN